MAGTSPAMTIRIVNANEKSFKASLSGLTGSSPGVTIRGSMPIVYDKLLALKIPEVAQVYTEKDAILYALGVGLGRDPMDADELPFVYQQNLQLLPTFAAVLGWPGFWVRDLDSGIDWLKVVAGEQGLVLHRPLARRGTVIGRSRITEIIDKGVGRGALVYSERELIDAASGEKIATVTHTT